LEKGNPLHLNKLESPPPKDDLCQVWLKLSQWFWRRRFLNDPTPFLQLSPLTEDLALHARIMCTKFDRIWAAGSGEDSKKFSVYFYCFAIISPWRGAIPFI
jgi:hypothetical protein